jgi:hypothetical protein
MVAKSGMRRGRADSPTRTKKPAEAGLSSALVVQGTVDRTCLKNNARYSVSRARPMGTSSNTQHFALKMSATLAKQFQDYAARCLELARAARTTAGRARFMQMAREYQSAASLIHTELWADQRSSGAGLASSAQAGWDRATALANRPTG